MGFFPSTFIETKRDGGEHSDEQINAWIAGFLSGQVADYQMSAWLMAVYLNGLNDEEMIALTRAMLHSGDLLKRPTGTGPRVDKHSTGGVGDKISLPLVGVAAACGLSVPMIAGRGLGHTGGTLDKLESIKGYRVDLPARRFSQVVKQVGASIIGQTKSIAPADRKIYALRDVTGTVACRPLIVASILSKKLAANLDGLVLDIKLGKGAFMTTPKEARALAQSLVQVATELGTKTVGLLTNMDQPLGRNIGNALEVKESVAILRGEGPPDSTQLTLELVSEMLLLSGLETKKAKARSRAEQALCSGLALERFCQMVALHGGDPKLIENPERLPRARLVTAIRAPRPGYVSAIDPLALAYFVQELGGGRRLTSDRIDPGVGIELCCTVGDRVSKGDLLAQVHSQSEIDCARVLAAFSLRHAPPPAVPLLRGRVVAR